MVLEKKDFEDTDLSNAFDGLQHNLIMLATGFNTYAIPMNKEN